MAGYIVSAAILTAVIALFFMPHAARGSMQYSRPRVSILFELVCSVQFINLDYFMQIHF